MFDSKQSLECKMNCGNKIRRTWHVMHNLEGLNSQHCNPRKIIFFNWRRYCILFGYKLQTAAIFRPSVVLNSSLWHCIVLT